MYTKTGFTPPFGRVFAPAGRPCTICKRACTWCKKLRQMQPSESTQFGTNGCALSYKWGMPIINIWGTHCRTNGGRCHRHTFQPFLRPLLYRWGTHCRTNGGRCHRYTFQPFLRPLSYRWGTHCRTNGGRCYSAKPREINLGGRA